MSFIGSGKWSDSFLPNQSFQSWKYLNRYSSLSLTMVTVWQSVATTLRYARTFRSCRSLQCLTTLLTAGSRVQRREVTSSLGVRAGDTDGPEQLRDEGQQGQPQVRGERQRRAVQGRRIRIQIRLQILMWIWIYRRRLHLIDYSSVWTPTSK